MARKFVDCRDFPSATKCTVAISADSEKELLEIAVQHAVAVHRHKDTPEFRGHLKKALSMAALIVVLLGSGTAAACRFDPDCSGGDKCVKEWGATFGICYDGGMNPDEKGDRRPGGQRYDPSQTIGKSCRADVECKAGYACLISGGSYIGVCVAI